MLPALLSPVGTRSGLGEMQYLRQAVAANVLPESKRTTLAQIVEGKTRVPARGLVVFKSVGTALQDLALATRYYELLKDKPGTAMGPEIASLRDKAKRKTQAS